MSIYSYSIDRSNRLVALNVGMGAKGVDLVMGTFRYFTSIVRGVWHVNVIFNSGRGNNMYWRKWVLNEFSPETFGGFDMQCLHIPSKLSKMRRTLMKTRKNISLQ